MSEINESDEYNNGGTSASVQLMSIVKSEHGEEETGSHQLEKEKENYSQRWREKDSMRINVHLQRIRKSSVLCTCKVPSDECQ